jgi:uncharacterized protein
MKVLFQLNHPAHYHLFKNVINILKKHGHNILVTSRNKDILEELLVNTDHIKLKSIRGESLFEKIIQNNIKKKELFEIVENFKPDLMIGTAAELSTITRVKKIPSFFFAEDDVNINFSIFIVALSCYPFFTEIFAPSVCYNSIWEKKTIKYNGYQKLAYLHPKRFIPDYNIVSKYFHSGRPYFLMRFTEHSAYHDIGIKGIDTRIAHKIISQLKLKGDVYISSERTLESQLECFRIKIDPNDMHHVLAFAKLYIGDSQSMTMEAAMLGTPSIRYNDFVGKISVLNELEYKYGLTYGIKPSEPEKLFSKIEELLSISNLKEEFHQRRQKMLSDKIDVTAFITWFIENYPESSRIIKKNPDYQYRFK